MKMNRIVLFLVLLCSFSIIAQKKSDSIKRDIDRFSSLLDTNLDSAFYFINKAHRESIALGNDSLMARTYYNIGFYKTKKLKENLSFIHLSKLSGKKNYYL